MEKQQTWRSGLSPDQLRAEIYSRRRVQHEDTWSWVWPALLAGTIIVLAIAGAVKEFLNG